MNLQFDPNHAHEVVSVAAVVDLFDGQRHFKTLGLELKVLISAEEV